MALPLKKMACGWALMPANDDECCFGAGLDEPVCTDYQVVFENAELQEQATVTKKGCTFYVSLPDSICAKCQRACDSDDEVTEEDDGTTA